MTIDPVEYENVGKIQGKWPREALQEQILAVAEERGLGMWTGVRNGYLLCRISGYREWEDDESLIGEVLDLIERVAIVQANDTSDTGVAKMYHRRGKDYHDTPCEAEKGNHRLLRKDTYVETQYEDGCQVGEKAASVMHVLHDIPCVASPQPFVYDVEETH